MLDSDSATALYADLNGNPLQKGKVYFGVAGQNPVTAPVSVYWDAAGTQPAAQPVTVSAGRPINNGAPARVWTSGDFSRLVLDAKGRTVFYEQSQPPSKTLAATLSGQNGALAVGFIDGGAGAAAGYTVQDALRETISAARYGMKPGASAAANATGFANAVRAAQGKRLTFLAGSYDINPVMVHDTDVSDVDIDFAGTTINCVGARTQGTEFDWEYAVFSFFGSLAGPQQTVTTTVLLSERDTKWQVAASNAFAVGDFWEVEVDPGNDPDNGGNYSTKTVWRMLRVTGIVDATTVTFDYTFAFDIPIGTTIRFRKVNPIKNIRVRNLERLVYNRAYGGTDQDKSEASSGISFYYAVNCHLENFEYVRNPKQAAHFEYAHCCSARNVRMYDPIEVNSGGYCLQFTKSVYFFAQGCKSSADRHLLDVTGASNGLVLQCVGHVTTNATFTTHGNFEHDVSYEGCIGHFQLAGSGPDYGQTALRISVKDHDGSVLKLAGTFCYDITIEDSRFTSTADLNVDGLVLRNVEVLNDTRFVKTSSLSARESLGTNCFFKVGANFYNAPGARLTLDNCTLPEMADGSLVGTGELKLRNCRTINTSASAAAVGVPLARLEVVGGTLSGVPLSFNDASSQVCVIKDCEVDRGNRGAVALVASTKPGGSLDLVYAPRKSSTNDRHITAITAGAVTKIRLTDTELVGGSIRVDATALSTAGSWFVRDDVVYNGCAQTLPAAGANVAVGTELSI